MRNTKIDWSIIVEEAKKQISLGQDGAAFELGCFLEDLKEKMNVNIPKETLDNLFKIVQKQAAEKQKSK